MGHELTATVEKVVEVRLDYDGTRLHEGNEAALHTDTREWTCECGDTFESEAAAIDHLDEMNTHIKPDKVIEVTEGLRDSQPIERDLKANGFIVRGSRNRYYVGLDLEGGCHIVAKLWGREKTRHQNEPRMQTKTVYVVTATLYHVESLPTEPTVTREFAAELDDHLDAHGDKLEEGYTPAYRTDSVSTAVENAFKWYTVRQD